MRAIDVADFPAYLSAQSSVPCLVARTFFRIGQDEPLTIDLLDAKTVDDVTHPDLPIPNGCDRSIRRDKHKPNALPTQLVPSQQSLALCVFFRI